MGDLHELHVKENLVDTVFFIKILFKYLNTLLNMSCTTGKQQILEL